MLVVLTPNNWRPKPSRSQGVLSDELVVSYELVVVNELVVEEPAVIDVPVADIDELVAVSIAEVVVLVTCELTRVSSTLPERELYDSV